VFVSYIESKSKLGLFSLKEGIMQLAPDAAVTIQAFLKPLIESKFPIER
jgi:hypothetical protein